MALEQSVEAINKARPEVSYDTLSDDAEVVQSSLSEIRYVFIQRGFSNRDAQQATLQGWRDLRTKKLDPDVALSPNDLFKCVTGFGKLFIASLPGGALIEIDGSPARDANNNQETTECVRWTPSGEHRVRLTLVGYEPLEDTCTVVEGKPNKFEKTLRPLEKKN